VTPARLELLRAMEAISEEGYHSGWQGGLERELWDIIDAGVPVAYGHKDIDRKLIEDLRRLREQAGGWWAWSEEFGDAVFVTLGVWLRFRKVG